MAEPVKAQSEDVEHKVVGLAEAKAGVKLRADRRVVLTVKDLGVVAPEADSAASDSVTAVEEESAPAVPDEATVVPDEVEAPAPNFHVQLELPDGSDYARNKSCVLEIPGHPPLQGTTNDSGELVLSAPNVSVEGALLRLFDGGAEIAAWPVMLREEEGS